MHSLLVSYKRLWFLLLDILATHVGFAQQANAIDALQTDADVMTFWQQHIALHPKQLKLVPFYEGRRQVNDSLGANNWLKTDIDHNGETDLLIFRTEGITQLAFVLSEKKDYRVIRPSLEDPYRHQFVYPVTKTMHRVNSVLLYSQYQTGLDDEQGMALYSKLNCDTLVVRAGQIVNYSSRNLASRIASLTVENNGQCEGDCPTIKVFIDGNKMTSTALKEQYWNQKRYTGTLPKKQILLALDLLNYANFPKLHEEYSARPSDQTTTVTTIIYDNGRRKVIRDYGASGSFTLAAFYTIVYGVDWVLAK
ncbi:DUF6438 domain-containing protein [Hymenobacter metallicola]|uniref:DUF6438 domain-containing protein n=1 Tax=Hymenobacter metallicola TaxID=2563114 RepID=A0A4Z0PT95_9BACT|nr:DUF6438 domain-containing protein [Hymenobacter metallicola]TGE20918.1 hypothetical protein E5K02_25290 [Hymenobacter metallicola]